MRTSFMSNAVLLRSLLLRRPAKSNAVIALSLSLLVGSAGFAASDTVDVRDSRGKNVQVQRPVKSVAIFPLPIPEAMIAIDGGTKRLTAINPRAKTALLNGVIGQVFPEIADISTDLVAGNFTPNVEEILRVKPDVIVQWDTNAGVRVEPMENAGLKVATASSATPRSSPGLHHDARQDPRQGRPRPGLPRLG